MGVRLPAEYQEVEYIQSHGTEWLNTGFSPTIETEVVIDFSDFDNNGNAYATPFGLAITGSHVGTYKQNNKRAVYTSFGSSIDVSYDTPYGWENRLVISQSKNGVFENNTHVISAYSNLTFTATAQNIYVFARSDGSGNVARTVILKLYGLQINDNGIQVRNYIPCYRKSDNKPGMYDLVSDEFFTNAGTGEFLVGPDVIDSISPMMVAWRRMLMRKPSPVPTGYVTDGLVLWLDGINKGNTPNAWDDLISGYSFKDYYGQVVFGSDYVEFADNKECYLYNQDFDVPRYTDGTIEIVYETNIAHAQILFSPKSKLSIAYGVGAGSVIWVKNEMTGMRPNTYKYPRFTSGSVSISLNSAYYDGAVQQNTGIDIWADDDRASTAIGKTYYRDDRCFGGKIYCIRIYNRQLTEAEVLANYAVDRSRFSLFN